MLENLHIKNLALIDEMDIDFHEGLNILTGETGAGKSILIGSINIALGQKVNGEVIRKGEEQASVELTFHTQDDFVIQKLDDMGIAVEDGTIIVSRRIRQNRSMSKVNDVSVTNAALKQIAALLLDIHGQHEHQSLLYRSKHMEILDRFGKEKSDALRLEIKDLYRKYVDCKKRMEESSIPEEERLREISFMQYEKQEIENARLIPGEEEELEKRYQQISNASTMRETLASVYNLTGERDSASEQIGRAIRELSHILKLDDEVSGFEEQLNNIDALLNDFNRDISDYMSDFEFDASEYSEVEERLKLIRGLKAKYGNSLEEIMNYHEQLEEKLQRYEDYALYQQELSEECHLLEEKLTESSEKLSTIRKENALALEDKIKKALVELNFLQVNFEIAFEKMDGFSGNGFDEVEFMISTNPGESLRPLGKVASGGELSRIMLAIKSVLADKDEVDTLIFDEIDTGISGRTAQKVSEKLSEIADNHQVICITHLPQIASMADEHYIIEKRTDGERTYSGVEHLTEEGSVTELARMLGGAAITENVISSAREMRELAKIQKQKKHM